MEVLCMVLSIVIVALLVKIFVLTTSINEICTELSKILKNDTNVPITVSSYDPTIRRLASKLNEELKELKVQRRKYHEVDAEIKTAITNISHDIRTPLTAISGYLELMEREEKSDDLNAYLSIVQERVETLKGLSEELFKYTVSLSVTDEINFTDVSINKALIENITDFYTELSNKNITPVINITDKEIVKRLDRASLNRIFSNILNNAIKYSDKDLEINLNDDGEIIFKNTAIEIDEIQTQKLFNRFFTVNEASNSTGLGLSIAKTLTEKMNGSITAEKDADFLIIKIKF